MEKQSGMAVLPEVQLAHRIGIWGRPEREAKNQPADAAARIITEDRRKPRFKIEIDITISSRTCGVLRGYTVDISEAGIAAMLPNEAPLGENVELNFTLPSGAVTIQAVVRQKRAFRYGFEFVNSDSMHEVIRRTCRDLAIDQSPILRYSPITPVTGWRWGYLMKILLVEDSKFLRVATGRTLARAGYEMSFAGDGDEALLMAGEKLPDLILLDMMLPKMSGLEVLKALKKDSATAAIPVIVLTGLSQVNAERLGRDGAFAFLAKADLALDQGAEPLLAVLTKLFTKPPTTSLAQAASAPR
jgi:CheY-like chemotaxis protein